MDRRSFLQVMGLAVTAPSFLVTEKASPPKRQNPDFITTGFPTIDDAIGGGFKRGTLNCVYGENNQDYGNSLLVKSIAIKAASDLNRRSSVLFVTDKTNPESSKATPFDGLLTITQFLDWSSLGAYDLVIIDKPPLSYPSDSKVMDWRTQSMIDRQLLRLSQEHNNVIVKRCLVQEHNNVIVKRCLVFPNPDPFNFVYSNSSMFCVTVALHFKNYCNMIHRLPELSVLKNRYGKSHWPCVSLTRPSVHFYEEAHESLRSTKIEC